MAEVEINLCGISGLLLVELITPAEIHPLRQIGGGDIVDDWCSSEGIPADTSDAIGLVASSCTSGSIDWHPRGIGKERDVIVAFFIGPVFDGGVVEDTCARLILHLLVIHEVGDDVLVVAVLASIVGKHAKAIAAMCARLESASRQVASCACTGLRTLGIDVESDSLILSLRLHRLLCLIHLSASPSQQYHHRHCHQDCDMSDHRLHFYTLFIINSPSRRNTVYTCCPINHCRGFGECACC